MVAGCERCDLLAHTFDDAGALVPEHRRRVAGRVRTGGGVEIGVADAAGDEADEDLARLRLGEVELLHLERRAELLQDGGADPHPAARSDGRSGLLSRTLIVTAATARLYTR